MKQTYETTQPWVIYDYLFHDGWWPLANSTRIRGFTKIRMTCAVCGYMRIQKIRMPRFGEVPIPESGRHPSREKFLNEHKHPDRGAPMSWAKPLSNLAMHKRGIDLDALAMRLEADMND